MNILPDPGIHFGHFRVLPYAPGGYAVIDDRRQPGNQKIARMSSLDDASHYAATRDAEDGAKDATTPQRSCTCRMLKIGNRVIGKHPLSACEIHP